MFLSSCIILALVSSISQIEGRSTTEEGDVCIVGAGIGGAAVAYFSNSRKSKVFEARDYVGGRLKHIELDGVTIELGGDAWSSANEYIEKIVKDLGINTTLGMKKKFGDLISKNLGIWTGESILNGERILIEHGISDFRGIIDESLFLVRLKENYRQRGVKTFTSIDEFLGHNLKEYTSISSRNFFTSQHIASATQNDLLEPLMRCIYGQGLSAHVFASYVQSISLSLSFFLQIDTHARARAHTDWWH